MTADTRPPILLLMGSTASGKTALAVELVQRYPFEIISVDSAQIYRDMDIGTAKPDAETRRIAPHRLLDILDPSETYSAGRFRQDVLREITAIQANGRIPLLVGGTMLYFRALEHGLAPLPVANPEIRARLTAERNTQGDATLHARLNRIDPIAAARIHPHDSQRIQRALEVYELTGQSLTELCRIQQNQTLPFRFIKLIIFANRATLHQRIEQRFLNMLQQGFVTEVEHLKARKDLSLQKPSMRAVGYRQVWEYLDGLLDYSTMVERGIIATRQLAKRQLTWLRTEDDADWLDSTDGSLLKHAISRLRDNKFYSRAFK